MKMTIETKRLYEAFSVLNTAKYTKLEESDKIKVWKIARALKPVATKFEDDNRDAAEKMKPERFDENLENAQEYEKAMKDANVDASSLKMGAAEYNKFISELKAYNELVGKTIEEYANKKVKVEFEPLSEDAFGKLMASNDWTMEQVIQLGIIIGD